MLIALIFIFAVWLVVAVTWATVAATRGSGVARTGVAVFVAGPVVAAVLAALLYTPAGYEAWPIAIFALVCAGAVAAAELVGSAVIAGFIVSTRGRTS
jgi:hypothetical protein